MFQLRLHDYFNNLWKWSFGNQTHRASLCFPLYQQFCLAPSRQYNGNWLTEAFEDGEDRVDYQNLIAYHSKSNNKFTDLQTLIRYLMHQLLQCAAREPFYLASYIPKIYGVLKIVYFTFFASRLYQVSSPTNLMAAPRWTRKWAADKSGPRNNNRSAINLMKG